MRTVFLLVALGLAPGVASRESGGLTFDDIVGRCATDPALLARKAGLAALEQDIAATGRFASEGPTLDAELGPRRMENGVAKAEAGARVEVPLLSGRKTRHEADARLSEGAPDILAAEAVESRLRLRTAYLDAWLGQERLAVFDAQTDAIEKILASVRSRVEAGAEAPYEIALVEGELLRTRSESDAARAAAGEAWAELRTLAELPPSPLPLAPPGAPDLGFAGDALPRFESGALRRAVDRRRSLDAAFLDFDRARHRSRWAIAGAIGKEGHDSFATLGVGYRIPRRGETEALQRGRDAAAAALGRGFDAESARLATRFRTALERAERFGPVPPPESFDDALRAVALRMELGKERPSQALPVRRQILEARAAVLQRVRDAHVLIAEIEALTSGGTP